MRPLSYSQISLYQSCPLCYKLRYVDRLKPRDKWYFSFGTTMHNCTEYFFRSGLLLPPSLDELIQFYQQNWLAEGYESAEEEASYRAYGQEILTKFWEIHSAEFRLPVATEKQFNIDIGGVRVKGYIDRVDKLDCGGLSIIDYKASRGLFTTDDLAGDLQLTLYQLAAEQMWQLPVKKLTLYHLRSNIPISCEARSQQQLEEAGQLVLEVAEKIAAGRFPATENQFCPCDFPEHCPYYRQRYIETATPEETDLLSGMTAAETVGRYVSLQSQIKELQLQLDEIQQMLVDYCQANSLNRVYGRENAITYKLLERTGFDEAEVRALLEPAGIWEMVLKSDPSRIRQLIEDEGIAREIRDRLAALKRVVSTSPRLWVRKLVPEE